MTEPVRIALPTSGRDDFRTLRREHQAHAALADVITAALGVEVERPDAPVRPKPQPMRAAVVVDDLDPLAMACKALFDGAGGKRVTMTLDGPDAEKVAEHLAEYERWVRVVVDQESPVVAEQSSRTDP